MASSVATTASVAVVPHNSPSSYPSNSHSNVSFHVSHIPSLRLFAKGLHCGWRHSIVVKSQPDQDATNGPSNAAENSTKSEVPTTESKDANPSSEPSPVASVTNSSSEFITQVSSLVKLVDSRDVVELQLKQFNFEILIRKREALTQPPSTAPVTMQSPPTATAPPSFQATPPANQPVTSTQPPSSTAVRTPPPPATKPVKSSHPPLKCPMAGTFYRSPAPGEPAFVKVGDKVQKGQVLCVIEAMKLMNEIEADQSGTVVEILAEDGKPVSVDTPLFVIEP